MYSAMRAERLFRLAACVWFGAGCGHEELTPPRYVVHDSAGVVIVENDSPMDSLALGPRVYRIGDVDGPQALFQVRHAFLISNGGVAVVESSSDQVRVFDSQGQPVRRIGRGGQGPGEFRDLSWAILGPADSIVAFDLAGPGSASVFDSAGRYVRSFAIPDVGPGEPRITASWPNGDYLVLLQSAGPEQPSGTYYRWAVYCAGSAGDIVADLGKWPIGLDRGAFEIFAQRASFTVAGSQLLYTRGDRFAVEFLDDRGQVDRIGRVDRRRLPVVQEDIDQYWAQIRQRSGASGEAMMRRRLGDPVVADSMPAYDAILGGTTGGFWARRAGRMGSLTDTWDVFDPAGILLGWILLPTRFSPTSLGGRRVAGVTRDENEVEFVDVYEWTWPERSGAPTGGVHSR